MPDDVSHERRGLLRALGAEVVLTPGKDAMAGANQEAGRILERTPGAFLSGQGGNPANPHVHFTTTGPEIWEDTGGQVDVLVSTVGTGGTITGVGSYLRSKNPKLRIYAVEPAEAPVLSGGVFSPHKIQGIIGGNGFPPVLDTALYDEVISIPGDVAIRYSGAHSRRGAPRRCVIRRKHRCGTHRRGPPRAPGADDRHVPLRHRRAVRVERAVPERTRHGLATGPARRPRGPRPTLADGDDNHQCRHAHEHDDRAEDGDPAHIHGLVGHPLVRGVVGARPNW